MKSQEELVPYLKENVRVLGNPRLDRMFRAVDRKYFVPKELQDEAYENYPLPIGFAATISQPTTVAFMLEKLDVRLGQKVLDVGSGSGWTTALLANLVGTNGKVIGVEIIPELVALGRKNLARHYSYIPPSSIRRCGTTGHSRNVGISKLKTGGAEIRQAKDGIIGLPKEAPFDRILVSAASPKIPHELLKQLSPNGVMVIPIGAENEVQKIVRIQKKSGEKSETKEFPGFVFVPLR